MLNIHMYMKRLVSWSLVFGIAVAAGAAPENGGFEGGFLDLGAGARPMGFGQSFLAVADDATAAFYNPAGLAQLGFLEMNAMHHQLWEGITYDTVTLAYPTLSWGAFGFSAAWLNVGGVERRTSDNVVEGGVSHAKLMTSVSYAYPLLPHLSVAVTGKSLLRWLDGQSGFFTADFSVWAEPFEGLTVGGILNHALSTRFGDTEDVLPLQARAGVGYRLSDLGWLITGQLDRSGHWSLGTEYALYAPLQIRGGWSATDLAAGVGIAYQEFRLDYGAGLHRELGWSHRVSLNMRMGEQSLVDQRQNTARLAYLEALRMIRDGRFEEAREQLRLVKEFDPLNPALDLLEAKIAGQTTQTQEAE